MYAKIMVGIDSSATAAKALDEAIRLAVALKAELQIVHAADESLLVQHGMGLGSFIDIDKVKGEIHATGRELLNDAVAKAAAAGWPATAQLIESADRRVADMIAEAAQAWGADLLVVGTHGRRGFERLLVGSVAEHLVRTAQPSLLLVREG